MPKPKTIKIDCSKQMNKDIEYDKTSFVPDMEPFIEEYKRKRDFLEQIDKQNTKNLMKHIAEAVKAKKEFEK